MDAFLSAIAPIWTPHPGQLDFLTSTARTRVLACGRRWGKTDAVAVDILRAIRESPPGKTLLVAPTVDQARLVFDRLVELVRLCADRLGWFENARVTLRPHPRLEVDGHVIDARSGHTPRHLRGREADRIIVDEAAFVKDELVHEVLWPMLATTGGTLTLLSTPNGLGPFWDLFRMGRENRDGVWSRCSPTSENPLVRPDFLAGQRAMTTDRAYRTEYEAEFLQAAGSVFREESIAEARVAEDAERTPGPVAIGVDWARTGDHTAVVVVEGSRGGCTVERSIRIGHREIERQVADVAAIVREYPGATVASDCSGLGVGPTERLREVLRTVPVTAVHFTPSSKTSLVTGLQMLFERAKIRLRPDPLLESELADFVCVESSKGVTYGARRGHDDLVIALALATSKLPRSSTSKVYVA